MGTYTQVMIRATIKQNVPLEAENVLRYFFQGGSLPTQLPEHPLFKTERWFYLFQCCSHPHEMTVMVALNSPYRFVYAVGEIKNYDGEIDKFFDWVSPYVDEFDGRCIGWSWHEDNDAPELILKSNKPR